MEDRDPQRAARSAFEDLSRLVGMDPLELGDRVSAALEQLRGQLEQHDTQSARDVAIVVLDLLRTAAGAVSQVLGALPETPPSGDAADASPAEVTPQSDVEPVDVHAWSARFLAAVAESDADRLRSLVGLSLPFLAPGSTFGQLVREGDGALIDGEWASGRRLLRLLVGTTLLGRAESDVTAVAGLTGGLALLARLCLRDAEADPEAKAAVDAAAGYANSAREVDERAALAHAVRAEVHLAADEVGAAARKAERATRLDGDDIDAWLVRGMCAERQGRGDAEKYFARAADLVLAAADPIAALRGLARPAVPGLIRAVAAHAERASRPDVALRALNSLPVSADPTVRTSEVADARLRATCLQATGDSAGAADALCDAADRLISLHDLAAADEVSREATELDAGHVRAWLVRADALLQRAGSDPGSPFATESRDCAVRARDLSGDGLSSYALSIWAFLDNLAANRTGPDLAAHTWGAVAYAERFGLVYGDGAYSRALLAYQIGSTGAEAVARGEAQQAYELDRSLDFARNQYLISSVNFGDFVAALETLTQAPRDVWFDTIRANVLARLGRFDEARGIASEVLAAPDLETMQLVFLADAIQRSGDEAQARELLERAWRERGDTENQYVLGMLAIQLGDSEGALEAARRHGERADVNWPGSQEKLVGCAQLLLGDLDAAGTALHRMIDVTINPAQLMNLDETLDRLLTLRPGLAEESLVADLRRHVADRARALIATDLVAADFARLPRPGEGVVDPVSVGVRLLRARYAAESGDHDEAARAYRGLVQDLPGLPELRSALADVLRRIYAVGVRALDERDAPEPMPSGGEPLSEALHQFGRVIALGDVGGVVSGRRDDVAEVIWSARLAGAVTQCLRNEGATALAMLAAIVPPTASSADIGEAGREIGEEILTFLDRAEWYWAVVDTLSAAAVGSGAELRTLVEGVVKGLEPLLARTLGATSDPDTAVEFGLPPVLLLLGAHHVPADASNEGWALLSSRLPELIATFRAATGLNLPRIQVSAADPEDSPDSFAVFLDGTQVDRGHVPADCMFTSAHAGGVGAEDCVSPPERYPQRDPLTGEHGWWLPAVMVPPEGARCRSPEEFVVRELGAVLAEHLDVLVGAELVGLGLLAEDEDEETFATAVATLPNRDAVAWFEAVIRDLVADGLPAWAWGSTDGARRWPPAVPDLLDYVRDLVGHDVQEVADRVRLAFRADLPGNDERDHCRVDQAVERRIDDLPGDVDPEAARALLGDLADGSGWRALVVGQPRTRRRLRALLRLTGARVPVVTAAEAAPVDLDDGAGEPA